MGNRTPIVENEWYHCFNRGVDRRIVFQDEDDYERFLVLLYVSNDQDSNISISDLELRYATLEKVLKRKRTRGAPLIDIGAYALIPNHIHLIARPLLGAGLSRFMQKVFTGYTMYFNKKYARTGALFSGTYKSKHLNTDEYFKHALQYVLFNPIELFEPNWKRGAGQLQRIERQLREYKYASVQDFLEIKRPERCIVHSVKEEYFERRPSLSNMLKDAQAYYRENSRYLD